MGVTSTRMVKKKLKNLSSFGPFFIVSRPLYADSDGPDDEAEKRRKASIAS